MISPAERERLRALITEKESYEGALDRREIDGLMLADDQRLLSYHNGACSRLANAVPSLLAEVDALTAQLAALREAVEKYGKHNKGCLGDGIHDRTGKPFCSCGFHETRIAVGARDFAALVDARPEKKK